MIDILTKLGDFCVSEFNKWKKRRKIKLRTEQTEMEKEKYNVFLYSRVWNKWKEFKVSCDPELKERYNFVSEQIFWL